MTTAGTHGAKDANGIYQYGGLDKLGPVWSDGLNLLAESISDALGALTARLTSLKTSNLAMTTGTLNALAAWDASPIHTMAGITWDAATGLGVCVTAGLYKVRAQIEFAASGTGVRLVAVQHAVAALPTSFSSTRWSYQGSPSTTNPVTVSVQDFVQLAVGDVIRIVGQHTAGANLNLTNAQLEINLA